MADLLARFKLVDEMSDKLGAMAESGQSMITQWEQAGEAVNSSFEGISSSVTSATASVDGVATSIDSLQGAAGNAASSSDALSDSMDSYGNAAAGAAEQTDYWTDAVGNYDKSALEAVYSTEELVEMGLKSAEALEEQERMFELCEQSASSLSKSIEATADITSELASAIDEAASMSEELAKSDEVSAETKEELTKASEAAAQAMNELTAAQQEAEAAMQAYDDVMISGTTDLSELEAAAERAGHAAENLAEANGKASEATEELSKATEKAAEEEENAEKSGIDMAEGVASALAAAGITAMVKEAAEAVYDLATAFSEAESTVVLATGATGDALDGLTSSMMDAYAASKTGSLDDTAAAVGEINTRLGYTGDTLTETTGLFLDFAKATGGNAATSARSVTQLMNQWNVPASEMESVLDKLTYAGQASGISVDTLTSQLTNNKAILDQLGFSLDEATAMFMNFELSGTNATSVMTGFRTALASGDISSLDELYEVFDQIASGAMTAADASEMFGTKAGPAIVNAVQTGTLSLDEMVASLEATDGTLDTTAEAAQTLDEKWEQATNNISAAFTSAVQPAVDGVSSAFAELVNGIGTFLNEHPTVTKAITAIGVGLGVVVAGIAGVTFVTTVAIPAVSAFGVALNTALGPIGWVALAITGIVAAGTALVAMMSDAEDETEGMTQVTKAQYYELQDLNAEYDEACEKYGENSEEASRLKYQIDDLTEAYEASKQTLEEFQAEVDELCESVSTLSSDYSEAIAEIDATETGTFALIQKYEDLATQADLTGAEQKELEAVTKKLADTFPDLADELENTTTNAEDYVETLKQMCEQQAEEQRQQETQQAYVDALVKRAELTEEIAKAEENLRLSQESDDNAAFLSDAWFYDKTGWLGAWATDTNEYADALDELNAANAENEALIAEIEGEWEELAAEEEAATENITSWEEAAAVAYENVQDRIEELCEAYDEAYQAALESFEGQFSLFDEASTTSEEYMNATVENAQAALDSQLAYWESYNANLETLTEYGDTLSGEARENYEALLEYASDGSEEAAGLAASMAAAIESGDAEAVEKLSQTVADVATAQQETAATTADWVTDFTAQMDEIEQEMQSTVDGMNLDTEAAASATATITSYADSIRAGKSGAVAAAQEVANAVSAALASANTTVNISTSGSVTGHAKGTTNAESVFAAGEEGPELIARPAAAYANGTTNSTDFYMAGENGPEFIVGQQGSTVFPTEETDRLIRALGGMEEKVSYTVYNANYEGSEEIANTLLPLLEDNERLIDAFTGQKSLDIVESSQQETNKEQATEQVKRILLEVAGSGAIEIAGNGGEADKETVLEILYEHLKPVLMSILQSDIYEEGELTYEY